MDEITSDQFTSDGAFLGAVSTPGQTVDWRVTVNIRKEDIEFKMDTGAEVDAISVSTFEKLGRPKLCKPTRVLYGPAKQPLEVLGVFSETVRRSVKSTKINVQSSLNA